MWKRSAAILLLSSLLAFQASPINVNPFDLLDEAQALMIELQDAVAVSYYVARDRIRTHADEVSVSIGIVLDIGNANADLEMTVVNDRVDSYMEACSDSPLLDSCLGQYQVVLDGILQDVKDHLLTCVTLRHDEIILREIEGFRQVNSTVSVVYALGGQLGRCNRDDVICIATVIGQVPELQSTLPGQVIRQANEATLDMDDSLFELERCATVELVSVVEQGDVVLDLIRSCTGCSGA